jgi:hypothetical protein
MKEEENKNKSSLERIEEILRETDKKDPYIIIFEEDNNVKSITRGAYGDLKVLVGALFIETVLDEDSFEIFADGIKSAIKLLATRYVESKKMKK